MFRTRRMRKMRRLCAGEMVDRKVFREAKYMVEVLKD